MGGIHRALEAFEAFEDLLAASRPAVVAACRQALRVWPRCAGVELGDLVQEAHVALWRSRDRLLRARNPCAYARRVALRAACRYLRRQPPV